MEMQVQDKEKKKSTLPRGSVKKKRKLFSGGACLNSGQLLFYLKVCYLNRGSQTEVVVVVVEEEEEEEEEERKQERDVL
jgi:hypothetical protein